MNKKIKEKIESLGCKVDVYIQPRCTDFYETADCWCCGYMFAIKEEGQNICEHCDKENE